MSIEGGRCMVDAVLSATDAWGAEAELLNTRTEQFASGNDATPDFKPRSEEVGWEARSLESLFAVAGQPGQVTTTTARSNADVLKIVVDNPGSEVFLGFRQGQDRPAHIVHVQGAMRSGERWGPRIREELATQSHVDVFIK